MARADGRPTWVGGNLGFPLIAHLDDIRKDDIVVQELSSFQLEIWQHSPHVAAILNVTPNHLDRHKTMDVYTEAKANILRFQTERDVAILPARGLEQLFPLVQGRLRLFGDGVEIEDGTLVRGNDMIVRDGEQEWTVCHLSDVQLRGKHNLLNVLAAVTLADSVGISHTAMRQAIATFTGIAHRLERVALVEGVQYINDSIATAPERAIAAINAFNEPLILLAGGRDKDLDWDDWARLAKERCKAIILFGEIRTMVAERLASADSNGANDPPIYQVKTLAEAVSLAARESDVGDVVLLSPGGTSFDAYVDFAERGEHFRQLVKRRLIRTAEDAG
jgi:UDP-N-acetylmuramoylalanine--D-glutamate ligase